MERKEQLGKLIQKNKKLSFDTGEFVDRIMPILKDAGRENIPSNYLPIKCLAIMYKVLTETIAANIYEQIE